MARRIATAALLVGAGIATGAAQTQPPKQQPAPPQAQPQAPQGAPAQPQDLPVVYTPWTKLCTPVQNPPQAKPICVTVKEARLETGQFLAGAALVEQEGVERKLFRITLPLGMQIGPGTRVVVDQDQPLSAQYAICTQTGCLSEYQVNADFVKKLKGGRQMLVQGINLQGQAASYPMPLGTEFAKANEGPPTDPATFEKTPARR
ncbi:MAG: invasion-associated locus B family protein [Bradyrhizobiaceae bacterium]|nr:MAG: invasion-associated locus B family protein [Bradyrhizobiaceae bacterium]